MDVELKLSNSQNLLSYQALPGDLRAGMASIEQPPYSNGRDGDGEGVREHAASVEDSLRYRSRSSGYNGETGGGESPPLLAASPAAEGTFTDDFIDINPVSRLTRGHRKGQRCEYES